MHEFKLERYFAKHEFASEFLLSPSDCESLSLEELLKMADSQTLKMWENLSFGYTESQGHPALREEIAALYENVDADEIVVAAPEECIYIAMATMLRKGDKFVHPFPAYQSLYEIAVSCGCLPEPWPLRVEGNRWKLDIKMLKEKIVSQTRLFILNFPHNPTGFMPTLEELEQIVSIARKNDILIFSDEMYRFLEHNPQDRLPAICDIYENGVSLFGMSKSLSLPGLRIGWLATKHKALKQNFIRFKDYTTICNSAPSEILAIMGLQAKEELIKGNRKIVSENLSLAKAFFVGNPELFVWIEPQGGSIAFPKFLGKIPLDKFCEKAAKKMSLMILPASIYDYPESNFRVGLGRKNFPEALERLEEYLNSDDDTF